MKKTVEDMQNDWWAEQERFAKETNKPAIPEWLAKCLFLLIFIIMPIVILMVELS